MARTVTLRAWSSIPDLLIAAAAELNQHTVLHLNKDFDLVTELSDQPVQRLRIA